jgi:hypothetical protein
MDDGHLVWFDSPLHVITLPTLVDDLDVPIAEDGAARHIAPFGLLRQGVTGPLAGLIPFVFGPVKIDHLDELLDWGLQRALTVLEILEDT